MSFIDDDNLDSLEPEDWEDEEYEDEEEEYDEDYEAAG